MKVVLAASGGLDSTVLLATALNKGHTVQPVHFTYGSKHNFYEREAINAIAVHYGLQWRHFDLTQVFAEFPSALMRYGRNIPEGHYQEESMRQTVIPGRNLIFLSILAGVAESSGADEVWLGVHQGDHFIYPDCRPAFIQAAHQAVLKSTDGKVMLSSPFLHCTKADIVHDGLELKAPLGLTRTCYKDQPIACGKCGSCQERLESFNLLGEKDPLKYESTELLRKGGS